MKKYICDGKINIMKNYHQLFLFLLLFSSTEVATQNYQYAGIYDTGLVTNYLTTYDELNDAFIDGGTVSSHIESRKFKTMSLNGVDLGDAGNFVILSKSGITNVYPSLITGDVGTSPITGAALLLTCDEVTGTIYTVAAAGPLPCRVTDAPLLTTAVLDMQTAYTDAAGRPSPDVLNLGAGVIGGQTLVPGLYKWTSTLVIANDITLDGSLDDVWIFQVAGTFNMSSSAKITLTGGAQAKNIFWQTAGAVTLGTTSHFEGNLLGQTSIAVQTGATINGRLLAQTAVTLQQNNVTAPVDGDISSGNQGGLESNGSLAEKIAKRNLQKELINKNPKRYLSSSMNIHSQTNGVFSTAQETPLNALVPDLGPDSTQGFQSTPLDLLDLTNAVEVLSVDYFDEDNRKAVCLVTKTLKEVYSHTKIICDRAIGSEILSASTVYIGGGYPGTLIVLRRENGGIEYAMSFSLKEKTPSELEYNSHWNITDYMAGGTYLNFQLWGKQPSDVFYLSQKILAIINASFIVSKDLSFTPSPNLVMRQGEYVQGKFRATLINKKRIGGSVHFQGTLRNTEQTNSIAFHDSLTLTGDYLQTVEFETPGVFDAGLNIYVEGTNEIDAVYLADGAWIANYEEANVANAKLTVNPLDRINTSSNHYWVERSFVVSGEVKNYYSVHRPLRLGLREVDLSEYSYLSFVAKGDRPIEIVVSHKKVSEWKDQPRKTLDLMSTAKRYYVPLVDFLDTEGNFYLNNDISSLTFSVVGNSSSFVPFNFEFNNISFSKTNQCEDDFSVIATSYSNEIHSSNGRMTATNKSKIGSNVIYTSENSIEFEPGFIAEAGSVVSAQIAGCSH
jgi:hypothetical protein